VIAFIAGAATVLAFAPLSYYPLALVAGMLLARQWSNASPRACFLAGFWFGLGFFLAGVSWVYVSMSRFGGMPPPLAGFATAGLCAFLALFPAAAAWLQARIPAGPVARGCLLIPAAWVLFEWLRSWILTGFSWLSLGYALSLPPFEGYAPIVGTFGLSFIALSLGGMLWAALTHRRYLLLAVFAALALGGEGLRHVEWSTPHGEPFSAALLQGNIEQSLKFDPARYERTLETYAKLAEASRARLIVFPETAVPRFLDQVEPGYLRRLHSIAERNRGDMLLGVLTRRGDDYYNSVISFGAARTQAYHKTHLVPFGEIVPPGFGWTMRVLHIPFSDFSRGGAAQPLIEAAGQRIAVNVCYEDAFGEEIARRLPEATLLVNVSNVAWFGDSLAPGQHLQMTRMRALETARMHLTATNSGITAAIDRDGRELSRLAPFTEGRLEVEARGYTGATPYVMLRDWPAVLFSVLVLAVAVLLARRR
jgi:apolipoprotein N-acyltransferase